MICDKKEISEQEKSPVPLSNSRIFELSIGCSPENGKCDPRMCQSIILVETGISAIVQRTGWLSLEQIV